MKPPARRIVLAIHLWLALTAGLLLAVVAASGAATVFRTDLDWLYAEPGSATAVGQADPDATARSLVDRWPGARIQRLLTPAFTGRGDEWQLRDDRGTPDPGDDEAWKAFTDPADGRLLGDTRGRAAPAALAWMARFHHDLWLGPTGGILVGASGLCLLGFIATGLWLWWPGLSRLAGSFRLRLGRGGLLRCFDLHVWLGLVGMPVLLTAAVTGSMFEFRWMRAAVHAGLGGSDADRPIALREQPRRPSEPGRMSPASGTPGRGFAQAMAAASAAADGTPLSVAPPRPGRGDGSWTVLLDYPGNAGSFSGVMVRLDADLSPTLVLDPRTMSPGGWINGQLWGLHTGAWAGGWSRTLYLACGLLPAALLATGLGIWRHRRRNATAPEPRPCSPS